MKTLKTGSIVREVCVAAAVVVGLFIACPVSADIAPYIANVSGNLADWTTAVNSAGTPIETNIDFAAASLGTIVTSNYSAPTSGSLNTYQGSDGATMTVSYVPEGGTGTIGGDAAVVYGTGPDDGNASGSNPGEGQHAASNYLSIELARCYSSNSAYGVSTFTLSFDAPVSGVGMKLIDIYDPYTGIYQPFATTPVLAAYDGADGTGNLLGSYEWTQGYNFQTGNSSNQRWVFMGMLSTANDIRSVTLTRTQYDSRYNPADTYGIDDIVYTRVPDPASATLGVLGLCGVRTLLRRRRG